MAAGICYVASELASKRVVDSLRMSVPAPNSRSWRAVQALLIHIVGVGHSVSARWSGAECGRGEL
jgi:hypothetical protein